RHIITSAIEHPAVLNTLKYLETEGYELTHLSVDEHGQISLDELRSSIRNDTILITVMAANNEIGTILPISEIGKIATESGVLFHTDAVQAVGQIPINVREMNIDLLSFSGHKLGAAKGVGVLFAKKDLHMPPLLHGGGQERGSRSGTENVAGIVSVAAALDDKLLRLPLHSVEQMRDRLIKELLKIPRTKLTGDPVNRLPGIASFVFEGIEGESILLLLDQCGICASSGSACSSGSLEPSHVLMAIGLPHEIAHGSLRLSLGEDNTDDEIDYVLEKLSEIIEKLRDMSPLWQ
ncbi:MAG: aminotransferase class V-fold PLP-dependent enzyme, partial [Oscillospiraceae bacterium]|nr:aminotransferase class V-fold PLP-dependent enzyme [Oscillospiraceae bacterium]